MKRTHFNEVGRNFWWGKRVGFALKKMWRFRAKRLADRIVPHIPNNASVIDIGAGNGLVAEEIAKAKNAQVSLLDVIDWNISKFPVQIFDGKSIPYEDKKFDVALLIDVIHHSENEEALVREASRVAKKVIISEEVHSHGFMNAFANVTDNLQYLLYGMPIGLHHRDEEQWLSFFRKHYPTAKQVDKYLQHGMFLLD